MDVIEIGRTKAALLHQEMVAAGHDPSMPLSFARAAASSKNLEAEACEPGAEMLCGGRATFIADEPLILYEDCGSDFDRAFLVAHELGHSQLGDAVTDEGSTSPISIEPDRSAEPPRVGADRVVDYGRRQRREIQMDLFARELLLPRFWMRRLRVDESMTIEQIAALTGAPYAVVAQQMLDALLLPEQKDIEQTEKPSLPLNAKQKIASEHRGKPFLLEAGPGTGKTATLIARVLSLLRDGVDPRRILVLTFSNKAAGEVVDRVASVDRAAAAAMWIGTFHAFGLDLVRRFSLAFELPPDARLLDRVDAVELLENEFARLPLQHYRDTFDPSAIIMDMLAAISRAKDEIVDAERYQSLAQAMKVNARDETDRFAAEKALEVACVYRLYEDIKRKRGQVDFGDLVMRPVQVLEANADLRDALRQSYDHVLVDEYQDVNRSSIRLLSALTSEGKNLWVVGDSRQSIYRFRGASSFNMQRFGKEDFRGGERDVLEMNYRSYQEILNAAAAFARSMKVGGLGGTLHANRGSAVKPPGLLKTGLQEEQAVAIADAIKAMKHAGYTYRDHAVLCTGNEKVAEFAMSLERLGVPVLYLGNLFDRVDVKNLLAMLSLLIDGRATGLLRTSCMPDFSMPLEDVVATMAYAREHQDEPTTWRDRASDIPGLSAVGRTSLLRLVDALRGFERDATAWDVLVRILVDRTDIAASIARSGDVADRGRGIAAWVLLNFLRIRTIGPGLPIRRSLDRIRRIVRLFDDRDLRQLPSAAQSLDAVQLMTVHGSKGLEFPVVHFPGINNGAVPYVGRSPACAAPDGMIEGAMGPADDANRAEREAEQECLFYVAITRARDQLRMYAATRDKAGKNRALSPFIDRLTGCVDVDNAALSCALPSDPAVASVPMTIEGPIRLKTSLIGQLDKCRRRVLYSHLLEIGGQRRPTPFLTMHDAIRKVVNVIVESDVRDTATQMALLDAAFEERGLNKHGYATDYLAIARTMIRNLDASRAGMRAQRPDGLSATIGRDEMLAEPDDVLVQPNGVRTFRQINTGKARDPKDDLGALAFSTVIRSNDPKADIEFVYLADGQTTKVPFSERQLLNGWEKIDKNLAQVREGDFAPKRSAYTCPNCPAFFICGPLPEGTLKKIFPRLPD